MLQHWLLITFSWLGSVRLQYINTGGPGADFVLAPMETPFQYPLPYVQYYNLPTGNDHDDEKFTEDLYMTERLGDQQDRAYELDENLADNDFGLVDYRRKGNSSKPSPQKPNPDFSPWGGKRDKTSMEHMWSWKRGSNSREPSMPKRVRFSPWGGKRTDPMIYKVGDSTGAKIIFSSTIPELTRIMSSGGNGKNAGYQVIRTMDKRHPIDILTLSTTSDGKIYRETMPFKNFLESLPKMYKPGHPYYEMNMKKDVKKKVKFSAWGGKRSPPIIGPIWTPAQQDVKDSTLDSLILIRNS